MRGQMLKLMQGDCLELMKDIPDGGVDLVLTDPPYGTMKGARLDGWKNQTTEWDNALAPSDMFENISRILRPNGKCVLFSQEPYTSKLITEALPSLPFSYRAIWYKNAHANPLGAKTAMVNRYEDVCVFVCSDGRGGAADYMRSELKKSGMHLPEVNKIVGTSTMAGHYFRTGSQFMIPTQEKYELLQNTGFWQMPHRQLDALAAPVFNLWQGGKSKSNVLEYAKDSDGYHPTQKPVALLEDLIQTYSNQGDMVLDFTMGSGSTGVACINTSRNFIGIELDAGYFKIAEKRIADAQNKPEQISLIANKFIGTGC